MSLNDVRVNAKSVYVRDITYGEDDVTLQLEDTADSALRFEVKIKEKFLRKLLTLWDDMPV